MLSPRDLVDLTRFRKRIIKDAQRERDHVELVAEQLHVSSTLRRLELLEQKLETLMNHLHLKFEPVPQVPRVELVDAKGERL